MKEFLSKQGLSYVEKDVSEDRQAAFEMVRKSRQQGVPVTIIDNEVVVGFDKPRLENILKARARAGDRPPRLGIRIATAHASGESRKTEAGAYVGSVEANGIGARLGLASGDVIVALNGQTVAAADDVERIARSIASGATVTVKFLRDGLTLRGEAIA